LALVFFDSSWLDFSLWPNFHQLIDPSPAFTFFCQLNHLDLQGFEPITVGDVIVLLFKLSPASSS
jgi:hypothetical protein